MRRFIVFCRFSGMRSGEIRTLKWQDVRIETNSIMLKNHKTFALTKRPRLIPLNRVLIKMLYWLHRNRDTRRREETIFVNTFGRSYSLHSLTKAMALIREKAGLPGDVKLHGVRHTFATHAIMNGIDVGTLAQILGHNRIETTQRYMHLAGKTDHLNAAMEQAVNEKIKPKGRKRYRNPDGGSGLR